MRCAYFKKLPSDSTATFQSAMAACKPCALFCGSQRLCFVVMSTVSFLSSTGVTYSQGVHTVTNLADSNGVPRLVARDEFKIGDRLEQTCKPAHYHARSNDVVTAIDGTTRIPDKKPRACGYGTVGQLKFVRIPKLENDRDFDGLPDFLDRSPDKSDANGNGIADGLEDNDGDGLVAIQEVLYESRDNSNDSNGNGISDLNEAILGGTKSDFLVVPAVVSIHPKSTLSPSDVERVVDWANMILKQAKVKVTIVPNGIDQPNAPSLGDAEFAATPSGSPKPDNMSFDGAFQGFTFDQNGTPRTAKGSEVDDARTAAARNRKQKIPGGKGVSIVFGRDQSAGPLLTDRFANGQQNSTAGIAWYGYNTMLVQKRKDLEQTAVTIAHEVAHLLGIRSHPEPGTADDKPCNLMTTPNRGQENIDKCAKKDIYLSPAQLAQTRNNGPRIGIGTRWNPAARMGVRHRKQSPAELVPFQFGDVIDELGDQGDGVPSYLDITTAAIASDDDEESFNLFVSLTDIVDDVEGDIDARVSFYFDADGDEMTGWPTPVGQGNEREVRLVLYRDSETEFVADAFLNDLTTFGTVPIASSFVTNIPLDLDEHEAEEEEHAGDFSGMGIELNVPKELLGFTTDMVSVTVASSLGGVVHDTASFDLDLNASEDFPTLTLFAEEFNAGDNLAFSVNGLAPNTEFNVGLIEQNLFIGMTDELGQFNGSLELPTELEQGFYFLEARSADGVAVNAFDLIEDLLACDLTEDSICDVVDLDAMWQNSIDLTDDGEVGPADIEAWLTSAAAENGLARPYFLGDTNLDGVVNFVDFLNVSENFGGPGHWMQGDFDGDGQVVFADFLALVANFGESSLEAATVPEPTGAFLGLSLFALVLTRRRLCDTR